MATEFDIEGSVNFCQNRVAQQNPVELPLIEQSPLAGMTSVVRSVTDPGKPDAAGEASSHPGEKWC